MKKIISMLCLALVLAMVLGTIAYAACEGKGRSYKVDCWKYFGVLPVRRSYAICKLYWWP